MSRSRTRYDWTESALVVPMLPSSVLRAAARLRAQGWSGEDRLGARVRALVRDLGGYGHRRGRPPGVLTRGSPKK